MLGLTASKDNDIRSRILTIMRHNPEITLQKVTEECQRLISIKRDNTRIEVKNISHVQRIKQQIVPKSKEKLSMQRFCGGRYNTRSDCYFKNTLCFECTRKIHKASVCQKEKKADTKQNKSLTIK